MTFYSYMTRNFMDEKSQRGKLARDMKWDKNKFPRNGRRKYNAWHDIIYNYFVMNGACENCIHAFEECWKEYVECERKKLN